jgi:hypothetical protein
MWGNGTKADRVGNYSADYISTSMRRLHLGFTILSIFFTDYDGRATVTLSRCSNFTLEAGARGLLCGIDDLFHRLP